MFYRIYVHALEEGEDCEDCASVVFAPEDIYHEEDFGDSTSATVLAFASGFYCARIDAVIVFDDATEDVAFGTPFCFEADCDVPYPEASLNRPNNGQTFFTDYPNISDAVVPFRVDYLQATNLKVIVQDKSTGIPQTIYDAAVVPSAMWQNVSFNHTIDVATYDYWAVVENLCGETVTSQIYVFFVKPGWSEGGCHTGSVQTITSWSVISGGPPKDLTPYVNSGENFHTWQIREVTGNITYPTGSIVGGVLVGLAAVSPWSPPFFPYTGYMRLERVC